MKRENIKKILFLGIIFILAISLRIMYLNTAIWYDEACSWFTAKQSLPTGIMDNLLHLDLQHTPLYFFILHFWIKIFGDGEVAMKIPSLIFGLCSIPLAYSVSKKIVGKFETLFFTSIVALSPLMIIFSTEVRMYSMISFLVLLSINYLIDFEQKNDTKSLVKLVITNILIPYTLVGAILYNVSLFITYAFYLAKNNSEKLFKYLKFSIIEWIALIPYFCLIGYYGAQRRIFVVAHETVLHFSEITDVIKNFFGLVPDANIYWPTEGFYHLTLWFALLSVVPCCYFIFGIVKGFQKSENFEKVLYTSLLISFILYTVCAYFGLNVLTVRYILYLYMPLILLGIIGLSKTLTPKHYKCFLAIFLTGVTISSFTYFKNYQKSKQMALKDVRIEADKLNLNAFDMVIMPFASDAPYYFKDLTSPRVFDFDFHKQLRNPKNDKYYNKEIQSDMIGDKKYATVYNSIFSKEFVSRNYFDYFIENVSESIPKGRYILVAFYAEDAQAAISFEEFKNKIKDVQYVKDNFLTVFLQKYVIETLGIISLDFDLVDSYTKNNYSYLLYKKR